MLIQDLIDYKFTQTDFVIIYYLNKDDMSLSEIIEKTNYQRDTVNSSLKRLLENEMIERFEGENGKYIYRVPDELYIDFYDGASRIIDYMLANHREIMTPNICRIICYLLGYQSYSIPELVDDGWKPAATYNSTNKLLEEGIIEREGMEYVFSKKIRNISRKPDVLQRVKIGTFNFNDYKNPVDKKQRFMKFIPTLLKSSIWGVQEVIPASYPDWESELKVRGFDVIYPASYTKKDSGCMITVLLVAETFYEEYEPLKLGEDKLFNLRYTYGKMKTWNGRKLRILNVHVPQSYNVEEERKHDIKAFWELIIKEAKACRRCDEEFILMGDLNAFDEEDVQSENAEYLRRLSDIMFDLFEDWDIDCDSDEEDKTPEDWGYSWYSEDGKTKRRLDYIFVGYPVIEGTCVTQDMIERTIEEGISDHKAIIVEYHRMPTQEEIDAGVRI